MGLDFWSGFCNNGCNGGVVVLGLRSCVCAVYMEVCNNFSTKCEEESIRDYQALCS